ncbi:CoA-binding protein [Alicyclobacillus macrosporangiidus]|uniref:CoA-binding protein n=1 Tax=Alicyclobacillus macrosporangiidus TaxID=392015 RepID=UPI000497F7AD|nr:CoA-binding protein [Alicyclobacillus macrosporangiidus]
MSTIPDQTLADLMANSRLIASVGLIDDPSRPSYQVAMYQQSQGYKVIPVNPNVDSVLGHKAVRTVQEIPEPVDIVNVFTHGDQAPKIVDDAIAKGAKAVWLQPGVESPEAEAKARQAGLQVISHRCFKTEHQRLLSHQQM